MLRIDGITNTEALSDAESIKLYLTSVVLAIGMRILAGPLVGYEDGNVDRRGYSGIILLYESHAALHTYPDLQEMFFDIFSCRSFEVEKVLKTINDHFGSFIVREQLTVNRGIHWGVDLDEEHSKWSSSR
jgi:S-adenosylmethionine decarboxylase